VTLQGQNGTLQAALRLLACFHDHEELGPTEAAELIGVSTSAANRALITMAAEGFVERTPTGRYRIGLTVFTLGQLTLSRYRLRELAMPLITRVRDTLDETTQIGIPMGADVLYLDRLESRYTSWLHSEEYRRMPGGVSATGRAIAAHNAGFARALERDGLKSSPYSASGAPAPLRCASPYCVTDVAAFRRALAETRRRGYAKLRDEKVLGLSAIAAPVLLSGPEAPTAIAAVTVVGPTARVVGRQRAVVAAVLDAAHALAVAVDEQHRAAQTA
jgi:IclR family transcriptional regulator, KDG regulon repressor